MLPDVRIRCLLGTMSFRQEDESLQVTSLKRQLEFTSQKRGDYKEIQNKG